MLGGWSMKIMFVDCRKSDKNTDIISSCIYISMYVFRNVITISWNDTIILPYKTLCTDREQLTILFCSPVLVLSEGL